MTPPARLLLDEMLSPTRWIADGRTDAGIVLVSTSQFPQDRSFIGRLVNALLAAIETGALPGRNQTLYLRPAESPKA